MDTIMYTFLPQHTYEQAFKYVWLCVDSVTELHIFTDACMSVTWLAIQAYKYPPIHSRTFRHSSHGLDGPFLSKA